ncbi:MAG: hypothetical protein WCF99_10630 [Chloroflexales bacterium]
MTSTPGYQTFTVTLSDAEADLLRAELHTQQELTDKLADTFGIPSLAWDIEGIASAILSRMLRENAARQIGGER